MVRFSVEKMSCGHCVQAITRAVQAVDPEARVNVDLPSHAVSVDSSAPVERIRRAINDAGYPVREKKDESV
jgi:copper chaperone